MDVDVTVQRGMTGGAVPVGRIRLERHGIDAATRHFGAYHILEMGRHFRDYVLHWPTPWLQMFTPHLVLQSTGKQRAPVVTGNIGETIAGEVFRRRLGTSITKLRHIWPTTSFKSPDYLLDCRNGVPAAFSSVLVNAAAAPTSRYWPIESKAAKSSTLADRA
ncbi:MAG: hypothetical protein JNL96_06765 [Planctomycetaceae bacterium]|nr:hypothetical protein [Planctomycetaceae bacterium]